MTREFSILLPPSATEVQLPRGFLEEGARLPGGGGLRYGALIDLPHLETVGKRAKRLISLVC